VRKVWIVPGALAVIAAALAAYIWLVDRRQAGTDDGRAGVQRLLPELARGDITAIDIDPTGQGSCTLAREDRGGGPPAGADGGPEGGATWRIVPGAKLAAEGTVAELLDAVDGLEVDRITDAPPEQTGLDHPAATLSIATAHGRRFPLRVGRRDVSGRGLFVARPGDPRTYVVASTRLADLVERGCDSFRDRRLVALPAGALAETATALSWRSAAEAPVLLQVRRGRWMNDKGDFASRAPVTEALRQLAALAAIGFPVVPASGAPDRTLEVTTLDHATERWTIRLWKRGCVEGGAGTWLAERRRGADADLLCLDALAVDRLWNALEAARRRESKLLAADAPSIDDVSLAEGRRRVHLRRERGAWQIVEPAVAYGVDDKVIGEWLDRLVAMSIEGTPPTAAAPPSARRLDIQSARGHEAVDAAPPTARERAVRVQRAGEADAALAPAALFADLDPEPLRFRSRAVLSFARHDVESVTISSPAGRLVARPTPEGDTWRITERPDAGGADIDASPIEALVTTMANLRAERFPTPPPTFTAQRTIEVDAPSGAGRPRRYRLELARPCLGRTADAPVFEVGVAACAELWRPAVGGGSGR
jgi:hypothetical protein